MAFIVLNVPKLIYHIEDCSWRCMKDVHLILITEFTIHHVVPSISHDTAHISVNVMPLFHIHIHFVFLLSRPLFSLVIFLSNVTSCPSFFRL